MKLNPVKDIPEVFYRNLTLSTHHIHTLPVLLMMPHSRCNCRCVMCDIWKANKNKQELTREDLIPHLKALKKLRVRQFVFSGGEALLHNNLWTLCELIKNENPQAAFTLLSTGLLLKKHARAVSTHCSETILSLDGSPQIHNQIRNVPKAYEKLAEGVSALRELNPNYKITARCVLQKQNFKDLEKIIRTAKELGLNQISFLPADLSSTAFNREQPWDESHQTAVALTRDDSLQLENLIERVVSTHVKDFESGFIAESPDKLRRCAYYYQAVHGLRAFPRVRCNAPWVSAVIESSGDVQPCFFHAKIGNIREQNLEQILNSKRAIEFRKNLDIDTDPICRKCVCSLNLRPTDPV